MQTCPACGQENPDGFRLCGMCGAALASGAAPREERKVVTVLFTDLVGFTARAERLDPEDVRATLSPYYTRLRSEIERHGGTVEKFIGDAVMAVFGAPVSHEDDPERAVRAALAIRDAVGDDLRIRTAVNTGEALVALGARPSEGEALVSGDVVNTAARLQSAAPVNGILVGEATYRATRHVIEYREAASVEAKGKSEPVPVWEAVGARSRFGLDVEDRPVGPLVARRRELGLLADALARSTTEQTAQLVTLVGVPGIGKSRLVAELFRLVDTAPEFVWWRQGRSLPYGETQSLWALGEIVKAQAGILETDDARSAEDKLGAMVESAVPEDRDRNWVLRHLRPLAGIADAAGSVLDQRDEAFAAWRLLFESLGERAPLVLVFEDLHWADDDLLDFVDHLADWVATVPLLLVATARPELLERRPGWGGGKRNATTVSLSPLDEAETAELLGTLLDQALLPADVQSRVLQRAGGNPLYAQEYVRMLQDRGLLRATAGGWQLTSDAELPVPETVQGMIAARLDALPEPEKELVQNASVIGKVFWPSALVRITGDAVDVGGALHALERKEFVRRDRRSTVAGETQYVFLHLLVRDVAYSQIPRLGRVDKHRAAAAWLETLAPDRSEDRAEMLAHHYRAALTIGESAGVDTSGLRRAARDALVTASEHAEALNAWAAARQRAAEAVELADPEEEVVPFLLLRIARASFHTGELDSASAARARDRFLELGRPGDAADAEAQRSLMLWYRGDGDAAREAARQAVELVAGLEPSPAKAHVFANQARRACLSGDSETALRLGRTALELAERFQLARDAANALNTIGMARVHRGDQGGIADLERSIDVAERGSVAYEVAHGYNNLSVLLWSLGRVDEATVARERQREAIDRFGLTVLRTWIAGEDIAEAWQRGDYPETVELGERFLVENAGGRYYSEGPVRSAVAQSYAALGRVREALDHSARAEAVARATGEPQSLGDAVLSRATALVAAGSPDDAQALLDELLTGRELLDQFGVLGPSALLLAELGRGADFAAAAKHVPRTPWRDAALLVAAGRYVEAADRYAALRSRFLEAWCRLLAAEAGDPAQLEPARAFFARIGATPYLRRCEALFPASA